MLVAVVLGLSLLANIVLAYALDSAHDKQASLQRRLDIEAKFGADCYREWAAALARERAALRRHLASLRTAQSVEAQSRELASLLYGSHNRPKVSGPLRRKDLH